MGLRNLIVASITAFLGISAHIFLTILDESNDLFVFVIVLGFQLCTVILFLIAISAFQEAIHVRKLLEASTEGLEEFDRLQS